MRPEISGPSPLRRIVALGALLLSLGLGFLDVCLGLDSLGGLVLRHVLEPGLEDERRVDQLEVDHLRGVARTRPEPHDPRVAARPLCVARAELVDTPLVFKTRLEDLPEDEADVAEPEAEAEAAAEAESAAEAEGEEPEAEKT